MDEVLTRAFSLLGALMGENAISLTSAKSGLTVLALNDELNQRVHAEFPALLDSTRIFTKKAVRHPDQGTISNWDITIAVNENGQVTEKAMPVLISTNP